MTMRAGSRWPELPITTAKLPNCGRFLCLVSGGNLFARKPAMPGGTTEALLFEELL